MIETLTRLIGEHRALMGWLGVFSIVMFVGGLLLAPLIIIRLPADVFVRSRPPFRWWSGEQPAGRVALRMLKNGLGVLLVLLGIAMLVLPGQGLLTILMGIGLLDLPGKRRLEIALLRRRTINRILNGIRARAGHPPFELPAPGPAPGPARDVSSRAEPAERDPAGEERP